MKILLRSVWLPLLLLHPVQAQESGPFELREGDRVVFIGDTLIEREGRFGYIERNMTARHPDRHIVFRNLGWSADTPAGQSRASFDWDKGVDNWFERLRGQIAEVKPTVAFVGYGMASSFDGEAGWPAFEAQLNRLLDGLKEIDPSMRIVLLSPIRHEKKPAPLPDPARHNEQLAVFDKRLQELAGERQLRFVSLYRASSRWRDYTDNGIHPHDAGYQEVAAAVEEGLGWKPFQARRAQREPLERLRQAILRKNDLFFHRWRPQNSTYLFLFRKHEQGRNAGEIPMFDPLIEREEAQIAKLRTLAPGLEAAPVAVAKEPAPSSLVEGEMEFQTDPGVEISLFAENPLLAKPTQMNFDAEGRLWVASSSVYPQIEPGQAAEDTILVLEDRDGDGVAETSTVFADGLLTPTGVLPGDGGVYVGHSTELVHFKDTDGDGKADQKRIVLSGFGTEDTHHIIHTLRWGFDGQLYMNQSIYIHTHVETPHGVVRLNSGGILHLRPPTMELGVFMKGLVNSWGHHYDDYGQSFATDGAGTPQDGLAGISYVVPGAMYHTYAGARKILGSVSPGNYPKFCGLEILNSPHFPEEWQGNIITCDFRANRVVRFSVSEEGSAYVAREMPLLLRSGNVGFRPIDVKMGPDGALYIADWSNPIIQHGEVDFRDPRRDHVRGKIWRVTFKDRELTPRMPLADAGNEVLLDLLLSPDTFRREQARRILTERGRKIRRDLGRWVAARGTEKEKLSGLWIYQALDEVEPALLKELLEASDGRVRAAATRVLRFWQGRVDGSIDLLAARIGDDHPRVRLEALRALAHVRTARSTELVLSALELPRDRHLDYALWLTINELADPWVEAVQSGAWDVVGREKQMEFALDAIEPGKAKALIGGLVEGRTFDRDGKGPWIDLVGRAGGPGELRGLLDQALAGNFSDAGLVKVLGALSHASAVRGVRPAGDLSGLLKLLDGEGVRAAVIGLAGQWKLREVAPRLLAWAGDAGTGEEVRNASFNALRELGGNDVVGGLRALTGEELPGGIRQGAVLTLARLDMGQAAPLAVALLSGMEQEEEALSLWRGLLGIKGASGHLVKALPLVGTPAMVAKTGLRVAREGGRKEPELVLALARGANLDDAVPPLTDEEMKQLAGRVQDGDAARGEAVYRRDQLACMTCHAIGGVGGRVGPDLTSIGASAPVDYLIESLLYPNRKVKEGYHSVVVETKDGEVVAGILLRETAEQFFLLNASNEEIAVAKKDVVERVAGNSLMPTGIVEYLPEQERLDLFRFLSELGKAGPYDGSRGNVARLWRLAPATIDLAQFGDEKVLKSDVSGRDWVTGYSRVDGRLLKGDLRQALETRSWRDPKAVFAAARLQLAQAGRVSLEVTAPAGALIWVDGQPAGPVSELELGAGVHTVMIKLSAASLPEFIRVTTSEGTFLSQ